MLSEGTNEKVLELDVSFKPTTPHEFRRFIASRICLFKEKNSFYQDHWENGKGKYSKKKELGAGRFRTIHQNMRCDLGLLFSALTEKLWEYVELGTIFAIDELLAGTNTRSPVRVYMPRKPKRNGHLLYFVATKLDNRFAFILDIKPYIEVPHRPTPTEAFISLTEVLISNVVLANISNITLVADSAFTTKETINYLFNNKLKFILAANKYPSLPVAILRKETKGYKNWNLRFRAEKNISIFFMVGTKDKKVKLISNTFEVSDQPEGTPTPLLYYKTHFNKVDIFNKAFYFFRNRHRHHKWTHVFIDDAISIALANSLALYNSSNGSTLKKKYWMDTVLSALFKEL